MKKLDLDRDENGKPLPTVKNKEVLHTLEKKIGAEKMQKEYQKDFLEYTKWIIFDPRSKRNLVVYRTPELAEQAKKYWDNIDVLDQEYMESKKK